MANTFNYLPCEETGYFSRLVTDYLKNSPEISNFYTYRPTEEGLNQAIADRPNYPVDREVLTRVLAKQYQQLLMHEKVAENLTLLKLDNTFTVCTAHQPNLMTGYLYFVYKILHAVKLAAELKAKHPDKNFVPVYYMGSEDNDLEELGVFRFRGNKYRWDGNGQTGAVGRMVTDGLDKIIKDIFQLFGPQGKNCEQLKKVITSSYIQHDTIGAATQYLVNELFGHYGLIVLDPDEADFKRIFIPEMKVELLLQESYPIIAGQISDLEKHYKIQAHPRAINLFYLDNQVRERIEKNGDKWIVLNTAKEWNEAELLAELNEHPERFSPNVMLRGLFQEKILPDVAFIGGGAEVAYWMQLKKLFTHYNGFLPVIYLRQSIMFMDAAAVKLTEQLDLKNIDLFKPTTKLEEEYVVAHTTNQLEVNEERKQLETILTAIKLKAIAIDATLAGSLEASLHRIQKQVLNLEKKMLRAEKKKMDVQLARIGKLKNMLFPGGGLQERIDNFLELYLDHGPEIFDTILEGTNAMECKFLIIKPQ